MKNLRKKKGDLYAKMFKISNDLSSRYSVIKACIRFVNPGRILWFLSILQNIPLIKACFYNWPIFILDCFKLTKPGSIIYYARNGMKYKVRARTIDVGVLYEVLVSKCYLKSFSPIHKGDIVIDIGAHIGSFSLFISSFSKDIQIYAIEPQKDNFQLLCDNIDLNKSTNITPLNTAILSTSKAVTFYENKDNLGGHTFFPHHKEGFAKVELKITTLKNIFNKYKINKVRLLKMDCEGSEYDILLNCPDYMLEHIKEIVLEYHYLNNKKNKKTLLTFLKSKGFAKISTSEFPTSILYCKRK